MSRFFLSRPMVTFVLAVERWVLSALFLFLAFEHLSALQLMELVSRSRDLLPASLIASDAGLSDGVNFADYTRYGLLVISNFACGMLLLTSRQPRRLPTRSEEVVIPLAATFSYLGFNQRMPYPAWMTSPLIPPGWEAPLAAAGVGLCFVGAMLSLGAMLWLGRSLGIVISVRGIVLGGPYRYVRHPIYLGYLGILGGLLLTACTCRMLALTLGAGALLVWRARLEEQMLSEYSADYREWLAQTGFLWPKGFSRAETVSDAGVLAVGQE